ncbi:unnamed protein product [Rhizoctonia solani]|uniref:Uncharacterized protein n=1 Tax=Rhizoctonia solani TaxID=456999 RepID=A0A8H3CR96_9AGAM|nr:unnamed protein product [Rhizoctonia solani]
MSNLDKMKSDIESALGSLVSSTHNILPTEANRRLYEIGNEYFKICSERSAQTAGSTAEEEEDFDRGNSTPGVPQFFSTLWETVIGCVNNSPVQEQAHSEHITRLVDLVGKIKDNSQSENGEWSIRGEKCGWSTLPLLGQTLRDHYNEPIDTMRFSSSSLLCREGQASVAGAFQLETSHLHGGESESDVTRLAKSRHQWLSLQSFISLLWRDCGYSDYALYAIWALRSGLEDWPESPPVYGTECDTFEESPAYLAFQVEAATIWICNTAPLMYKCTEIWGPKGNPDWPKRAGAPGRGGKRWDGVDGYDHDHKRWQVWKDVLNKVILWCGSAGNEKFQDSKVNYASKRALDAMEQAER